MTRRNPSRWLMTDERMGDALWPALRRLPPGSGIVVRHHALAPAARRALIRRIARIAAARRLVLLVGGGGMRAVPAPAGVHGGAPRSGPRSHAGHDRREAIAGIRLGARWLFVSPVAATASHPGQPPLTAMAAARIARVAAATGARPIALGGMDERQWRRIAGVGFAGWAGIDAWIRPPRPGPSVRSGTPSPDTPPGCRADRRRDG